MKTNLSILIPARNEIFLARTVQDILEHSEGKTEIIVVCDGGWPLPPIEDHPRVTLIYHKKSIGQRAAVNEAARLSESEFIMKSDAHCSFSQGFDVALMDTCKPNWTIIPQQRNLHVFDWRCKICNKRTYQGPRPVTCSLCKESSSFEEVIVWEPRANTRISFMRFDNTLHFQYWREYKKRPEGKGKLADTMSCLGACWLMRRSRYWDLNGLDEGHGSWGQMGTEIACKAQLSGGRLVVNKSPWFAHLFRTQKGFGFPYPNPGISKARTYSRWLWVESNWEHAIRPLSWLLEKYWPIPGWEEEDLIAQKERES
jgi:hypothetical protein